MWYGIAEGLKNIFLRVLFTILRCYAFILKAMKNLLEIFRYRSIMIWSVFLIRWLGLEGWIGKWLPIRGRETQCKLRDDKVVN